MERAVDRGCSILSLQALNMALSLSPRIHFWPPVLLYYTYTHAYTYTTTSTITWLIKIFWMFCSAISPSIYQQRTIMAQQHTPLCFFCIFLTCNIIMQPPHRCAETRTLAALFLYYYIFPACCVLERGIKSGKKGRGTAGLKFVSTHRVWLFMAQLFCRCTMHDNAAAETRLSPSAHTFFAAGVSHHKAYTVNLLAAKWSLMWNNHK